MSDDELISQHFEFFGRNGAGCAFAAQAARDPCELEWGAIVIRGQDHICVHDMTAEAVLERRYSTLSLIFPDVISDGDLDTLVQLLDGDVIYLNDTFDTNSMRCYRFRARIGTEESFVSGFGAFEYFPVTRQAPATSLVMRIAPRPLFEWYFKEPEAGIVHVADMDMKGLSERQLKRMWNNSFLRTAGLLGHKPDAESAAKTTFVVPLERAAQISVGQPT